MSGTFFGLYQTLTATDVSAKDLTQEQKKILTDVLNDLNIDQETVVLLLICEHARLYDQYNSSSTSLPYHIQRNGQNCIIDVEELPTKLKRVLWRFKKILKK